MSYEVIARKWRPQRFEDVVGQDHVTQTLGNAIKSDRTAHAYLFVGPRGIGKTSVARIFAKALNCEKGPAAEPCCECNACKEIAAGSNMDVIEIDGASNNSVDQVRDLRETVKYAPSGNFKIYIIDEVHMLSTAAFNALLKTLEEPPPFVKFIFATTEPQKILPTIISRCQRFDLRRIPVNLIIERLMLIAKSEKVKISDDALLAIARGAEGGLRDAESALDQLISFRGTDIKEEDVLSVFGLVSRSKLEEMAGKILAGDIKALIMIVAELDESGKDLQRLLLELVGHFRNLLISLNIDDDAEGMDFTEAQLQVLKKQAEVANTGRVLRVCAILAQAEDKMKYALSRRTVLEMALIRSARAAVVVSVDEILKKINELQSAGGGASEVKPVKKKPELSQPEVIEPEVAAAKPEAVVAESIDVPVESNSEELNMLRSRWHEILGKVGKNAPLARSVLMDAIPLSVQGRDVVIGFDPEFADEIDNFKSGRNRKSLEHVLQTILGRELDLELVVGGREAREQMSRLRPGTSPGQAEGRDQGTEVRSQKEDSPSDVSQQAGGKKSLHEWIHEPAVRKTLEVFDGTILDVRE
jgi:DNA polymerase-3 subunit gamma/tau